MSDGKKYYCFCSSNCKYETMTKEQILSAITQAASGESVIDPDAGVISKVKETNTGGYITFWVGTQAQYNALQGNTEQNCLYIITDDTLTREEIERLIGELQQGVAQAEQAAASMSAARLTKSNGLQIVSAGAASRIRVNGDVQTTYSAALGMAHIKAVIEFKGAMQAGEIAELQLSAGLFRRTSHVLPDVLTVTGYNNSYAEYYTPFGRLSAWMGADGCINLRADDGFTCNGSGHYIYISGWYRCEGGLTE